MTLFVLAYSPKLKCHSLTVLCLIPLRRWQQKYFEAKTSLQDRDAKVAEVSELVERDLILLGCTAIEDKLQVINKQLCHL